MKKGRKIYFIMIQRGMWIKEKSDRIPLLFESHSHCAGWRSMTDFLIATLIATWRVAATNFHLYTEVAIDRANKQRNY